MGRGNFYYFYFSVTDAVGQINLTLPVSVSALPNAVCYVVGHVVWMTPDGELFGEL